MENGMPIALPKSKVVFDKTEHTYHLNGRELHGVTGIVHWLFPETYAEIPDSIMQAAADYGSMVHAACQLSDVVGITESDSVIAYQELKKKAGLTTIANEYLVSDEMAVASSIDLVCSEEGVDGDALADIKTTSRVLTHHLEVQLSIYAWLYEWQTGRKVGNLYCIWLPKPKYGQPALYPIRRISAETCRKIVLEYVGGSTNEESLRLMALEGFTHEVAVSKGDELPAEYQDVVQEVIAIERQMKEQKQRYDALKDGLLELMRANNVKKWQADGLTLTYIAPSKRKSIDSKALEKNYPDAYEACLKESSIKDSIKITLS